MTNILSLPLLAVTFETATNEDWRDGIAFAVAGSATAYAGDCNCGNGLVSALAVAPGAFIGDFIVTFTGATSYRITDPDGYVIGAGVVGVPFSTSGLSLTVATGVVPYIAGDTYTITVLPQAMDITGIRFAMQMRATTGSASVALSGSTDAGTLVNGGTSGVLGLAVPEASLAALGPNSNGQPYVIDIVGVAEGVTRRCVTGTVNVVKGVTYLS